MITLTILFYFIELFIYLFTHSVCEAEAEEGRKLAEEGSLQKDTQTHSSERCLWPWLTRGLPAAVSLPPLCSLPLPLRLLLLLLPVGALLVVPVNMAPLRATEALQ